MTAPIATDQHPHARAGHSPSWGTSVALLSVVSAVAVSVPFVSQPLLESIRVDFGIALATAGLVATSTQVGAALGILLLVPLADIVRPRLHLTIQLGLCSAAMIAAALVPTIWALCLALGLAALTSVVAQIILPMALRAAPEGQKARTAATLGGSLLFGIFGGRLLAGVLTAQVGWRTTLLVYGLLLLATLVGAWFAVPRGLRPPARVSYLRLLLSVPRLAVTDSTVLLSAVAQGLTFAAFNGLWTVLASHLMHLDQPWTATQAGLVNLVGLGAGVIALAAGPAISTLGPVKTLFITMPCLLLTGLTIAFTGSLIPLMLGALLLLSAANQISHVANQTRALSHHLDSAGRANTVYMFGVMLGGGMGAAMGATMYANFGLIGTALFGVGCVLTATLAIVLRDRRRARAAPATIRTPQTH